MINYFEFFDLPVKFNTDETELKNRYFKNLKANHPDYHIDNKFHYEQALKQTAINNEAYKCLSNLKSRAEHILSIHNIALHTQLPNEFLMEMMEINEAIMELKMDFNGIIYQNIKADIDNTESQIANDIKAQGDLYDLNTGNQEAILNKISILLSKQKYMLRLHETLANIATP
jgi:molecular chaperone HscB